jgi:predicted alpha/beta hydrolase family esterase
MKFVIFHGSFATRDDHWFPQLKEKLETLGQEVFLPQFPVDKWGEITKTGPKRIPKQQNLKNWLKTFKKVSQGFNKKDRLCFVGHSLGSLFILHIVDKFNIKLDCAIFVSPFLDKLNKAWQIDLVNKTFYKTDFDFKKLKKLIPVSYVLYSDNDPYVDKNYSIDFAKKLNSSLIFVRRGGHMNIEANLNEFPLVYELCKTRLDLSLYQQYLTHRRDLYAVDYIKGKSEEVVYLKPDEVFDEGTFHFRNLKKSGFCTFFTGLKFWDTQSIYMKEARKASKRVKNLMRVFVINKLSDLKKPRLLKQICLDIATGIKVYLCLYDEIKNFVSEPDFGIWDNDYLCIVKFNQKNQIKEIKLDSRQKDIKKALKWKKIILKKAVRIYNTDRDINNFILKHGDNL